MRIDRKQKKSRKLKTGLWKRTTKSDKTLVMIKSSNNKRNKTPIVNIRNKKGELLQAFSEL